MYHLGALFSKRNNLAWQIKRKRKEAHIYDLPLACLYTHAGGSGCLCCLRIVDRTEELWAVHGPYIDRSSQSYVPGFLKENVPGIYNATAIGKIEELMNHNMNQNFQEDHQLKTRKRVPAWLSPWPWKRSHVAHVSRLLNRTCGWSRSYFFRLFCKKISSFREINP